MRNPEHLKAHKNGFNSGKSRKRKTRLNLPEGTKTIPENELKKYFTGYESPFNSETNTESKDEYLRGIQNGKKMFKRKISKNNGFIIKAPTLNNTYNQGYIKGIIENNNDQYPIIFQDANKNNYPCEEILEKINNQSQLFDDSTAAREYDLGASAGREIVRTRLIKAKKKKGDSILTKYNIPDRDPKYIEGYINTIIGKTQGANQVFFVDKYGVSWTPQVYLEKLKKITNINAEINNPVLDLDKETEEWLFSLVSSKESSFGNSVNLFQKGTLSSSDFEPSLPQKTVEFS